MQKTDLDKIKDFAEWLNGIYKDTKGSSYLKEHLRKAHSGLLVTIFILEKEKGVKDVRDTSLKD